MSNALPFSPRCLKDVIEEDIFFERRDLFSNLDMVFFDTTSIYFEGKGGESLGQRGFSKDHRPDLNQMVVGVVIDDSGLPICCEMWPGNTADVKTLIPICDRMRKRFDINRFCIVADRGMISSETLRILESPDCTIPYILGARLRKVKEIRDEVLENEDKFIEIYPEPIKSQYPSPLQVKEVYIQERRYVVCLNTQQARKDVFDRNEIIKSLKKKLEKGGKNLIGNKGYRKYVKIDKGSVFIDEKKIESESKFDGKWVLRTNIDISADQVALKYKELWQVEKIFRDIKTLLETRPVYHHRDETIRGHIFCSFLALILKKELDRRLQKSGYRFEWSDIKQDLKSLQEIEIEDNEKKLVIRTQCGGVCGKIFQSVGVAVPPTIREL